MLRHEFIRLAGGHCFHKTPIESLILRNIPYLSQIALIGNNRPFPTCIVYMSSPPKDHVRVLIDIKKQCYQNRVDFLSVPQLMVVADEPFAIKDVPLKYWRQIECMYLFAV